MHESAIAGIVAGFLGGLLGAALLAQIGSAGASPPASQRVIDARTIRLLDAGGKVRAELAMSPDGGPALFFFDGAGRNRLVLGLYAPSEREAPFVVLNDPGQKAAGIFRLFGTNEAPVIVLKNAGRDRSIYGLNPQTLEPFLVNYAADGRKDGVFGKY
ncbi:MAG TPA: hypothetical protein VLY46_15495 [Usitatibacter sp.]|nr:hypothetical protein [Usitatibacter sp.]